MYHRLLFALLLLAGSGGIYTTLANTFQVISSRLETIDVTDYCDGLTAELHEPGTSVIVLQIGRSNRAIQIVPSEPKPPLYCDLDQLEQMILDNEVVVKSHRTVEYVTLITPDGEFLLTLERTDEKHVLEFESKVGGLTDKEKLLLSLLGGGSGTRVKSFAPVKNT
ncbi:uncharacterized protein LOC128730970 [Anopheles nili]|uniref:uncharacterized protein LOC128730970 n=1 Tax=Anopheles nili TaxID=185578 RepID=UPI00237B3B8D|nr:uncharacterized protein LOC128730970 [Anopheles nili]